MDSSTAAQLPATCNKNRAALREHAAAELGDADMVIDSIADLPRAVAAIDVRPAAGKRLKPAAPD